VLLPRCFLAGGGAVERAFAPGARFGGEGAADVALAGRLEDGLNLVQLSLIVLHVFYEGADGVVGAEDLLVDELFGEVLSEEGGEGGGGDVGGGEDEDVYDFLAGLVVLGKFKKISASWPGSGNNAARKWVPMDHPKSKKHEGLAVFLAAHCNTSKKIRIHVFEHFTHQLVIVLIDPLVTVCIRS